MNRSIFTLFIVGAVFALLVAVGVVALIIFLVLNNSKKKQIKEDPVQNEPETPSQSLAEKLKQKRIEAMMTQEEVAEAMKVSRQAVSKWEIGAPEPSTANLIELSKLYSVDLNELVK